jgi:hypothetical protein
MLFSLSVNPCKPILCLNPQDRDAMHVVASNSKKKPAFA